jgi:hypothetical protein
MGALYFFLERRESRLQERAAEPRKVSDRERQALLSGLRDSVKGPIHVNFLSNDSEAADYAGQFKDIFETAGFTITEHAGFITFTRPRELTLEIAYVESIPDYASEIEKAFLAAGFKIEKVLSPQRNIDAQSVSVNIGEKPPPQTGTLPWWYSLEKISSFKKHFGWTVLLLIPILIFATERRQKVLETREQSAEEKQHAKEKEASDKERAELKTRIAQHEEQYGPRRINEAQGQKLSIALRDAPKGGISVLVVSGDEEARQFGNQLITQLKALGYSVGGPGAWGLGSPPGLWLKVNNNTNLPPHAGPLLFAFRDAGLQIEGETDSKIAEGEVRLYVGVKRVAAPP